LVNRLVQSGRSVGRKVSLAVWLSATQFLKVAHVPNGLPCHYQRQIVTARHPSLRNFDCTQQRFRKLAVTTNFVFEWQTAHQYRNYSTHNMKTFEQTSRAIRILATLSFALVLASLTACGGGGGGGIDAPTANTPLSSTLSGLAAVEYPIANATISIACAAGSRVASTTTNSGGAWNITLSGQTLPCAIEASGGTISGVTNTASYHTIATSYGNVNITPLTELMVANLSASATPAVWFSSLSTAQSSIATITQIGVSTTLAKLQTAMPALVSLNTINPITTVFVPTAGDLYDDTLSVLQTAITNSGVSFASLLNNAAAAGFTAPSAGFSSALANAYSATFSRSHVPATYTWSADSSVYATGAMTTYTPSISSLSNGKVMAVFAQSEATGNKVYASLGDYTTATWETPVLLNSGSGVVGVSNSSGWNQPTTSTVVVGDVSTGNALAAWTTQISGISGYSVWLSSFNAATGTWSSATQVGTAIQSGLKSAASSSGGMAVAWVKSSSVNVGQAALATYLSGAGVVSTGSLELGVTYASAWKIGLSGSNSLVVAWSGGNQQVLWARQGTTSWTSPIIAGVGTPANDASLSLAVGADGSSAALWTGIDPSIHTAVYDALGIPKSTASLYVGSTDNARPSVAALPNGKFVAIFASSNIGKSSVLEYDLSSCTFDPATGWSTPVVLNTAGDVGDTHLAASNTGLVVAIVHGYNEHAYQLSATGALISSYMHYNGNVPAFSQDPATGRAVILWTNATQLLGAFFH
jgi:hypothetical protein